eukprot:TRINITY_DN7122_c0_g1_i1.p1 TRINITY_DN7122_c0_g1~~TRINITY_DN7122_c0_g1_i1.p1  ORF type:complete len:295 (-),score=65.47 TRINITY_DN7122_c0_g1_i1:21-905(-)
MDANHKSTSAWQQGVIEKSNNGDYVRCIRSKRKGTTGKSNSKRTPSSQREEHPLHSRNMPTNMPNSRSSTRRLMNGLEEKKRGHSCSKHANKYAKLKIFDKKIDEWAGGKEEGTLMLESYMESSYYQTRFITHDESKLHEQIGKNMIDYFKALPEKSAIRAHLVNPMSLNIPFAKLKDVFGPLAKNFMQAQPRLPPLNQDNLDNLARQRNGPTPLRRDVEYEDDDDLHEMDALDESMDHSIGNDVIQTGEIPIQLPFPTLQPHHSIPMQHMLGPSLHSLPLIHIHSLHPAATTL